MALTITHAATADATFSASGIINWNANHTLAGAVADSEITFTDNTTNNVSTSAHGFMPKATGSTSTFYRSDGTQAAPTASVTWDTISAAAGSQTTANGNNTITYNTAQTSNNQAAWTFGETSAATNGTITSGVANQVLLKVATLASSTQSPFQVFSRGTYIFGVDSASTRVVIADGSESVPSIAWKSNLTDGFCNTTVGTSIIASGSRHTLFYNSGSGFQILLGNSTYSATIPQITTSSGSHNTGLTMDTTNVGIPIGGAEIVKWTASGMKFTAAANFTANGATLWAVGNNCPGNATVQEWLTIQDSGGTTRYIPCF